MNRQRNSGVSPQSVRYGWEKANRAEVGIQFCLRAPGYLAPAPVQCLPDLDQSEWREEEVLAVCNQDQAVTVFDSMESYGIPQVYQAT